MLKIINLFVIEKIFENAQVSPMSKMVYISCLIQHFTGKEATISNAVAFDKFQEEIKFEQNKKYYYELHRAEIITLNNRVVIFNNVWGNFIDKTKLDTVLPEHYLGAINFYPARDFQKSMTENRNLFELCSMRFKLSKEQVIELIKVFVKEQETFSKTYQNESECLRHCTAWIGKHKDKAGAKITVKSNAKRL